jgi:hypothetical protein
MSCLDRIHIAKLSDDGTFCWCHSTVTHRTNQIPNPETRIIEAPLLNRQ